VCTKTKKIAANCVRDTCTFLTEFSVFVCVCISLPDDDLVEVETWSRDISDKLLFIAHFIGLRGV